MRKPKPKPKPSHIRSTEYQKRKKKALFHSGGPKKLKASIGGIPVQRVSVKGGPKIANSGLKKFNLYVALFLCFVPRLV